MAEETTDLLATRRAKLDALRAAGIDPFPHTYPGVVPIETNDQTSCSLSRISSAEDAAYFVKWIDAISRMADSDTGWRSTKEKTHVLGQFEEARQIYVAGGKEAD